MSTAPKPGSIDKRVVYGLIAVAVLILLVCGGVFVFFVGKTLFGSGGGTVVQTGKAIDPTEASQTIQLFVKDLSEGEYGHALKYRSTAAFRNRYTPDSLKELVESQGKGLIGYTNWNFKEIDRAPGTMKFICQVGGGANGPSRFQLTVVDDGSGLRIHDLEFNK